MCSRFQKGTILLNFCLFENNNYLIKPWIVYLKESLSVCLKGTDLPGILLLVERACTPCVQLHSLLLCSMASMKAHKWIFPLELAWMQHKPALESNVSASLMQLILVQLVISLADVTRSQPNHKRNKKI